MIDRIVVFSNTESNADRPPTNLGEYISWLSGKLELIPKQYRETAEIEIYDDVMYGHSYMVMEIFYYKN